MDQATRSSRVWLAVKVLGRLRDGVGLAEARAEMEGIAARLAAAYPATNRREGVAVAPLREQLVGSLRPTLFSLMGAVVLVMLIACANVANLLMVRAAANRREIAVRQALGANRRRLFSQFMAQTLVLCLLGGVLGVAFAAGALPLLRLALSHVAGLDLSMIRSISLNVPVLLFSLGVCMLTALVFGLLPVLKGSMHLSVELQPGGRASTGGGGWSRGALVAGEIAIAVVVLFLSTLMIRSFQKLLAVDPGFRTDHLLSAEITLPQPRYTDSSADTNRFYEQLLDKVAHSSGVVAAASTNVTPLRPSLVMTRFLIEGEPPLTPGTFPFAQIRTVSPDFFKTMGLGVKEAGCSNREMWMTPICFRLVNKELSRSSIWRARMR